MGFRYIWVCLIAAGLPLYIIGTVQLNELPVRAEQDAMRVVLPAPVQTVLALGDRFLAANAYVVRAATFSALSTDSLSYEVQGKVQAQASILNPYNEDNGMLATAVLPWEGQLDVAQFILARSTKYRSWDPTPPFFQGFNEYYFNNDPVAAGRLATIAAQRSEGTQKLGLQGLASKWLAHGQQPELAIAMIRAMIETTNDINQRRILTARVERLEGLVALRKAAAAYAADLGRPTSHLQMLVDTSYIEAIPADPFRRGYVLDTQGIPQFNRHKPTPAQGG